MLYSSSQSRVAPLIIGKHGGNPCLATPKPTSLPCVMSRSAASRLHSSISDHISLHKSLRQQLWLIHLIQRHPGVIHDIGIPGYFSRFQPRCIFLQQEGYSFHQFDGDLYGFHGRITHWHQYSTRACDTNKNPPRYIFRWGVFLKRECIKI